MPGGEKEGRREPHLTENGPVSTAPWTVVIQYPILASYPWTSPLEAVVLLQQPWEKTSAQGPGHRDEPPTQRCHHQEAQLPSLEAPQKKPPQCPRPQPPSQHRPPPTTDEAMYPEPNDGASHEAVDRQYNDPQQGVLQKNPTRAGPKPKQHGHTQQQPPQHGVQPTTTPGDRSRRSRSRKRESTLQLTGGIHHGRRGNRS
nr:putative uncharacterized protein DDB_G0294196 [Procambarus clarkii]